MLIDGQNPVLLQMLKEQRIHPLDDKEAILAVTGTPYAIGPPRARPGKRRTAFERFLESLPESEKNHHRITTRGEITMKANLPRAWAAARPTRRICSVGAAHAGAAGRHAGRAGEREYKASSGGGMVEVTISGKKESRSLSASRNRLDPDDVEMLADVNHAAVNEVSPYRGGDSGARAWQDLRHDEYPRMPGLF